MRPPLIGGVCLISTLFPEENILTKEIESWEGFADSLKTEEDKKLFLEMLEKYQHPGKKTKEV